MAAQHQVVIVGGGFAGLNAARALKRAPVQVTVIDRRNVHVFQPLLYQVATGGISPADICTPIRALLRDQANTRVILAEAQSVDVADRLVRLSDGQIVEYDTLIVAAGADSTYFGHEDWADSAPALKTVEDATEIRRRILFAFEAAERVDDPEERRAWLTFVVIGGGPTGVELAGAIGELARSTLKRNFRSFDPAETRILLVEGGDAVLPAYDERLRESAMRSLGHLGVTVRTGAMVEGVDREGVEINAGDQVHRIPTRSVIWAAGVRASGLGDEVARACRVPVDRTGRLEVEADLTVPGHPEIFVIGDLASYSHQTGSPLRGTADVAIAEGAYVGKAIRRRVSGKDVKPFRFRDLGTLAVIGRSAAVADLRFVRLTGRLAWWVWLFIHLLKMVDFQNRLTVMVQWGWSYFTRNRSARLITGELQSPFEGKVRDESQVMVGGKRGG